jgi:hypothetical protein
MHRLIQYSVGTLLIGLFGAIVFLFEKNDIKALFKTNKKK